MKDQILDLTDQLLNSGGSLSDGESVDNGNQGSANNRWHVDDNWCLIRNWRQNSNSLRFRERSLNWCRWSLYWSLSLNWHQIGEHDL